MIALPVATHITFKILGEIPGRFTILYFILYSAGIMLRVVKGENRVY